MLLGVFGCIMQHLILSMSVNHVCAASGRIYLVAFNYFAPNWLPIGYLAHCLPPTIIVIFDFGGQGGELPRLNRS
jgi:hypothetical protein